MAQEGLGHVGRDGVPRGQERGPIHVSGRGRRGDSRGAGRQRGNGGRIFGPAGAHVAKRARGRGRHVREGGAARKLHGGAAAGACAPRLPHRARSSPPLAAGSRHLWSHRFCRHSKSVRLARNQRAHGPPGGRTLGEGLGGGFRVNVPAMTVSGEWRRRPAPRPKVARGGAARSCGPARGVARRRNDFLGKFDFASEKSDAGLLKKRDFDVYFFFMEKG